MYATKRGHFHENCLKECYELASQLITIVLLNIFRIRCNSFKLLDHLQCLFLENLRGRMENKLACKRDSEKKQAMPLAARSLGKMSKMRDTIVSHYALAALHSGDKVILLVGLQK